jgi:protease I
MADRMSDTTVAFLATEGVEQSELTEPWQAVQRAGATTRLVSPSKEVQAFNHLDQGQLFERDVDVAEAHAEDFDALVLPGGVANPDALRTDDDAVRLVREFADAGKPIAVICHGPWTLIEAGATRGRTLTSWPSLRTDLVNAGATWTDAEVVVCEDGPGPIVSSRNPDDLPAFCDELLRQLAAR